MTSPQSILVLSRLPSGSDPTAPGFNAKAVFNHRGIIFIPVTVQHREAKAEGISYEDNHRGDALAALLIGPAAGSPGRFEIRYHRAFTDGAVARLMHGLLRPPAHPLLAAMADWAVTYQGRPIALGAS